MPNSDENKPVTISGVITDVFGLGKIAEILTAAIVKGIGTFASPVMQRRRDAAEISSFKDWQAALDEAGLLAPSGEISLSGRADIRLNIEKVQQQANREAIAVQAIDHAKRLFDTDRPNLNEAIEPPEPEWLSRYWRLADDISTEDFQAMWGRILARKIAGKSKVGARTLDFMSTLSRQEAAALEKIAACSYRTSSPDRMGLIFRFPDNIPNADRATDDGLVNYLSEYGLIQSDFGALGIFIEMWSAQGARVQIGDASDQLVWFGHERFTVSWDEPRIYNMSGRDEGFIALGDGYQMTNLGKEIVSLVDCAADQKYIDILRNGLAALGIKMESA